MKTAVVYQSKYGYTKKYAQWIANALGGDLYDGANTAIDKLAPYDAVVYGGSLYAGSIKGIKLISENLAALAGKRLAVFTVGLTEVADKDAFAPVIARAFPKGAEGIAFFHLRGGIRPDALSFGHKLIFAMIKRLAAKENAPDGMKLPTLEKGQTEINLMEEAAILPIVTYVREAG